MAIPPAAAAALTRLLGDRVRFDAPLAPLISMGVGGPADALVTVQDAAQLAGVLAILAGARIPRLLLGRGTNLLPSDAGFRGAVIRLDGAFGKIVVGDGGVTAGAAASLAGVVEQAMRSDLGGLEFTTGIPGCVGGSLPGNAGTAREALGDRVEWVEVMREDGTTARLAAADLGFGYRTSALRAAGVVTGARFRLEPRPRAEVAARVRTYTEKRRDQPLSQPNVGCIFKNPAGGSAGALIDRAGLKGTRAGRVEVSPKHANFMVNLGGARTADVVELIGVVRERVHAAHGLALEPEVVVLDEAGQPVRWPGAAEPRESAAC